MPKSLTLISVITLLLATTLGAAAAQDDQTISSLSGRYSFSVPSDWVVNNQPVIGSIQSIFPSEAISIADTQSNLDVASDPEFDPFESTDLTGAMIFATAWGGGVLEAANLDQDTINEELTQTVVADTPDAEIVSTQVDQAGLTGQQTTISKTGVTFWVLPLFDKSGNMVLIIAISDEDHRANVEQILTTLDYHTFPEKALQGVDTLTNTATFLNNTLALDMPAGWWSMSSGEDMLALPDVDFDFMTAFQTKPLDLAENSGIVIVALSRDKSTLPPAAFDESGHLIPDEVVSFLNLAEVTGQVEELENIQADTWLSNTEVQGLSLLMDLIEQENMIAYMVVLDGEDNLSVMISIATPDVWAVYQPTVEAIFKTARFVEVE